LRNVVNCGKYNQAKFANSIKKKFKKVKKAKKVKKIRFSKKV
jgi:hypothetical protein